MATVDPLKVMVTVDLVLIAAFELFTTTLVSAGP